MKRALDVVLSATLLIVGSPFLIAIWVAIRLTSPGPAIFRQARLGRDQRPFTMFKFRTMRYGCDDEIHRAYVSQQLGESIDRSEDAAPPGPTQFYKLASDPRVTPLGNWLRRSSLDELPQLVNVLLGEMSLVGPRPVLAWEAKLFDETELLRFVVAPGMTGLWQVSGRSRLPMRKALELDVEYVARQSMAFDLMLLARTVPALLRRGAA